MIESGTHYYVEGGVFTDTQFVEVVAGTEERYGPFKTYDEALACWQSRIWWNVDICEHRLVITAYYLSMNAGEPA